MSPRRPKATKPAEPQRDVREGFSYTMPQARGVFLRDEPAAYSGMALVYRYRVTVERIEEPREIILARMVDVWRGAPPRSRDTLESEARRAFGVDLRALAGGAS